MRRDPDRYKHKQYINPTVEEGSFQLSRDTLVRLFLLVAVITLLLGILGSAFLEAYRVGPGCASHGRGARDGAILVFGW